MTSKTLCLRNLPEYVTDADISLCIDEKRFGRVSVFVLDEKQAFATFEDVDLACLFLEEYKGVIKVLGQDVYFTFHTAGSSGGSSSGSSGGGGNMGGRNKIQQSILVKSSGGGISGGGGGSSLAYVANLDEKTICDELFILCGLYGDVDKVKIMKFRSVQERERYESVEGFVVGSRNNGENWEDNYQSGGHDDEMSYSNSVVSALVQFVNEAGLSSAWECLKGGLPLHGRIILFNRTNHYGDMTISDMEKRREVFLQYADYSNSPYHRFSNPKCRNSLHKTPPTNSIYFFNLDARVDRYELRSFISKYGDVEDLIFFGEKVFYGDSKFGGKEEKFTLKMGVAKLGSVSQAVRAIIKLNNVKFYNREIRCNFAHEYRKKNRERESMQ